MNVELKEQIEYILKYKDKLKNSDIDAVCYNIENDKQVGYTSFILTDILLKLGYTKEQILNKMTNRVYRSQFETLWDKNILEIPDNIKIIDQYAFAENRNLNEVYIGKIKIIDRYAFKNCVYLTDAYIDLDFETASGLFIFSEAFKNCPVTLHFKDKDYEI